MKNLKIASFISVICFLFSCNNEVKYKKALSTKNTNPIDLKTDITDTTTNTMTAKKVIIFNPKLTFTQTPLTFTFTYKNHLYRFYAYANYLLPDKTAKEKNRKQLNILASVYEGQQGDDFNDGADLKIEVLLVENTPLKIASGYFSIDGYKMLDIVDGNITIIKKDNNIISGHFTFNGKILNKETGKIVEKFTITDGKFEKIPVMVRYISNFEEGWIDPNI